MTFGTKDMGAEAPEVLQRHADARCLKISLSRLAPFAALRDLSVHDHRGYGIDAVLLRLVHPALFQVVNLHIFLLDVKPSSRVDSQGLFPGPFDEGAE